MVVVPAPKTRGNGACIRNARSLALYLFSARLTRTSLTLLLLSKAPATTPLYVYSLPVVKERLAHLKTSKGRVFGSFCEVGQSCALCRRS